MASLASARSFIFLIKGFKTNIPLLFVAACLTMPLTIFLLPGGGFSYRSQERRVRKETTVKSGKRRVRKEATVISELPPDCRKAVTDDNASQQ